ncbi:unnamed protein product, partial [Discosporangium mesarthrocarpum]
MHWPVQLCPADPLSLSQSVFASLFPFPCPKGPCQPDWSVFVIEHQMSSAPLGSALGLYRSILRQEIRCFFPPALAFHFYSLLGRKCRWHSITTDLVGHPPRPHASLS